MSFYYICSCSIDGTSGDTFWCGIYQLQNIAWWLSNFSVPVYLLIMQVLAFIALCLNGAQVSAISTVIVRKITIDRDEVQPSSILRNEL